MWQATWTCSRCGRPRRAGLACSSFCRRQQNPAWLLIGAARAPQRYYPDIDTLQAGREKILIACGLQSSGATSSAHTVLGVGPAATQEEIGKAYRRLAARWHPDKWMTADASERRHAAAVFVQVQVARDALLAPQRRVVLQDRQ